MVPDDRRERLPERAPRPDHLHHRQRRRRSPSSRSTRILARWFDVVFPGGIVQALLGVNVVLSVVAVVLVGLLARDLYGIDGRNGRWCCSPCSPARSCCRGRTPRRRSSCAPRRACCSCNASSGCSPASPRRSARRRAPTASPSSPPAWSPRRSPSTGERQWRSLVSVALAPVGVLAYHAYLRVHTGEWGAWNRAQREAWNEGWSWGATAIRFTWRFLENPLGTAYGATYLHTALALAMLGFGLFCSIRVRLPWPMLAYVAVIAALMIGPDTVSARPRFVFTAFPLVLGDRRVVAAPAPEAWDACSSSCRPAASPRRRCSTARSRRSREQPRAAPVPVGGRAVLQRGRHGRRPRRAGARVAVDRRVVVVDDGSTDGTAKVLADLVDELDDPRLTVRHPRAQPRQGGGAAQRVRRRHRRVRRRPGRRPRVRPAGVRRVLEPLERGVADVVFGSRFLSGRPHRVLYFWHSLGNRVLTLLSNMFTDLNLTDMETCYKCFRREVLDSVTLERTASGSSRSSRPRSPAAGGGSTRSASPTAGAPTPRARRSAGATACGRRSASSATPPVRRAASAASCAGGVRRRTASRRRPRRHQPHRLGDDPARHLRRPVAAVAEHDRRLHHPQLGAHEAADELGEEGVALGAGRARVDLLAAPAAR